MNDNQALTRFLAFAVLVSCSGLGFCLGLLGLTWSTGKLPFGMQPLIQKVEKERHKDTVKEKPEAEKAVEKQRYGEVHAARLYSALEAERKQLAAERKELQERRLALEEFEKTVNTLNRELKQTEQRVKSLLIEADKTERDNVRRMSLILAEAETEAGAQMLLKLPATTAARVLRGLDPRKSAPFMAALLGEKDPETTQKAEEILSTFQTLASMPNPKVEEGAVQ